jgi:hypothetical protein
MRQITVRHLYLKMSESGGHLSDQKRCIGKSCQNIID